METKTSSNPADMIASAKRAAVYRIGGYCVSFVTGSLAALAVRYLLFGKALQLNPDTFISLVFTVAIGAASLVLALLAINYGRVSEKVITERADRSIEIQMNLFEKSLDLQTRLFDKTISTLESIGRSTGVTEQRMADIFSFFQNPDFMKQIAGRAVEETTSELGRKSKEGVIDAQTEAQLAERLTKNIVRELSSRFEGLETAVKGTVLSLRPTVPDFAAATEARGRLRDLNPEEVEARRRAELIKKRMEMVRKAVESIPEAQIGEKDPSNNFWDYVLIYKGKKVAIDIRGSAALPLNASFDNSIKLILSNPIDCVVLVFFGTVTDEAKRELDRRSNILAGRLKYISGADESTFQNDLLGVLESVSAALPSSE